MYRYFFDLGSVLVNYDGTWAIDRLEEVTGVDRSLIAPLFRHELLYQVETNRIKGEEFFKQYVSGIIPDLSYDEWINVFVDVFSPNPPALELLHYLRQKGRKTYILSNLAEFHKMAVERKVEGIFDLCDYNFFSYELGFHKPERQIYEEVCKRTEEKPENCVFFDDLPMNIEGAKNMGMTGILYSNDRIGEIYDQISRMEKWERSI